MRIPEEHFFAASDGTRLFYRYWPASGAPARQAVILFHRGHEHSGRLQHIVDELDLPQSPCSPGTPAATGARRMPRRRPKASIGTLVNDVDVFVRHVSDAYGIALADIAVVAQSVGSVLAATWVHDYAPPIRCMVLASPAFKVKLYVPFARPFLGCATGSPATST